MQRHQSEVVGRQRTAEGPQAKWAGLVAHLVRDEGVAGSNPATPTSFLVAPMHLRGQLCGTKLNSDNLAPPIPIHSAPSGGGAGVGIWKRCQMSTATAASGGRRMSLAGEASNIRLFLYCCGPQPTPLPSPEKVACVDEGTPPPSRVTLTPAVQMNAPRPAGSRRLPASVHLRTREGAEAAEISSGRTR
jgi:hypothetical protein